MAKQDEKQRLRRRLQEYAIELATTNRWEDAMEINRKILTIGEDPETYNRLGKALMEQGNYEEAHDAYQQTLRLNPVNTIARKNLARLESLLARGIKHSNVDRSLRQQVDLRIFIAETGKTALTTLANVTPSPVIDALITGEKVELHAEERNVFVLDAEGNYLGRLEPKLGQRLVELIHGGNRYVAAIAQSDPRQVRILIREVYQDPSQRGRLSFPGKLGESLLYVSRLRYDEYVDEILDEEEITDETDQLEEDNIPGGDEEEIGLEEIEQDSGDDDDGADE